MDLRNITKITRNMTLYKNTINRGKEYLNDTEFEMVRYVTKREKRSLVEVANYLNVDKGLVTRMYKKLVGLGYLEVKSDENDSRKKILVATPKAKEIKDEIATEEKNLSLEEINQLDALIEKVYLESKKLRKNGFKGVIDEKDSIR